MKNIFKLLWVAFYSLPVVFIGTTNAQTVGPEFPIATAPDSTFATAITQDDEKYLVIMRKDIPADGADVIGQFVSKDDNSPIGEPITIGSTIFSYVDFDVALPQTAFDGNRFLVVWSDSNSQQLPQPRAIIKGKFIQEQGETPEFEIDLDRLVSGAGTLHFNPRTNHYFLVSYNNSGLYGQFINKNGEVINRFQLTSVRPRKEYSLAFGDTSYLVCWVNDENGYEVIGQIIGENGTFIYGNFLIDGSEYPSDNPLYVTYDGSKFIVIFTDKEGKVWKIYARFVTEKGEVKEDRPLISQNGHLTPYASIKENTMFVTWTRISTNVEDCNVIGRFFDLNGKPTSEEFTIFGILPSIGEPKIPVRNFTVSTNSGYNVYTNRVFLRIMLPWEKEFFIDGDVYGVTVTGPTYVENRSIKPKQFELAQNFPNPFNPTTQISFSIPTRSFVTLKVFNLVGEEVATILSEELPAGTHIRKWNAEGLPSGVYFYRIMAGLLTETKKLVLLR